MADIELVIKIPESEIPKKQDIIEIPLHFIDGKVCEAGGYGFDVLPKGHRDLIDHKELKQLREQEPCEDCISRQEAIDELSFGEEMLNRTLDDMDVVGTEREKYSWGLGLIETNIKDIESLPPVTPQQKIGWWIDDKCSVCGKGIDDLIDSNEWYENEQPKFCPFCGVKLEGAEMTNGDIKEDNKNA